MEHGTRTPAAQAIVIWRQCPRCGALGPCVEYSGRPRAIQPQCCGSRRFGPARAVWPDTAPDGDRDSYG